MRSLCNAQDRAPAAAQPQPTELPSSSDCLCKGCPNIQLLTHAHLLACLLCTPHAPMQVRLGTVQHALLRQLVQPDRVFGEALKVHYSHQGQQVRGLMQQWVKATTAAQGKAALQQAVRAVELQLDKLPPPQPPQQQQQQQQHLYEEGVEGAAAAGGGGGSSRRQRGRAGSRGQQQQQPVVLCIDDDDDDDVVDLT